MDATGLSWILAILAGSLIIAAVAMLVWSSKRREIPLDRARKLQNADEKLSEPIDRQTNYKTFQSPDLALASTTNRPKEKYIFFIGVVTYVAIATAYSYLAPAKNNVVNNSIEFVFMVPLAFIFVPMGLLPWILITAGVTSEPWITYHVTWKFLKQRYYLYLSGILYLSFFIVTVDFILNLKWN